MSENCSIDAYIIFIVMHNLNTMLSTHTFSIQIVLRAVVCLCVNRFLGAPSNSIDNIYIHTSILYIGQFTV